MALRGPSRNHKRGLRSHGRFPGTSQRARRADALPWKRWQNGTRSHQRRPRANKAPVRKGIRRGSWVTCQTPTGQPVEVEQDPSGGLVHWTTSRGDDWLGGHVGYAGGTNL